MFARFYRHDGNNFTFISAIQDIISYDYTKRWTKSGDFSLVLPYDSALLKKIKMNDFVEYDGDWLFIENIRYDMQTISLSGHDAKQLLYLRISVLGSLSDQFDGITGTTAECIRYFLDKNIISPVDSVRELPVFWKNGAVGFNDDGYMTKLENIGDIVEKLCNSAGIGYELKGNLTRNRFDFQLKNTVDKSKNQSQNTRVIFSAERQNLTSVEFEHDETNLYNAITAQGAGTLEVIYRDNNMPVNISRRECTLDVSVNSISEIRKAALFAAEENIDTHTCSLKVPASDYETKFSLGDIVSVRDDALNNYFSAVITEVHVNQSAASYSVDITLGQQKPKLLNKITHNMLYGIKKG